MSNEIKPPPHSVEAEQGVIGALLRDNDALDRIGDLRAEHFYLADHAAIFRELLRNLAAGRSCDVVSLGVAIGATVPDCMRYLNEIAQSAPSPVYASRHAAIVRDKAIKRGLIRYGREIAEAAANSPDEAAALVDQASSVLEKLAQARVRVEPVLARDELAAHIEELQRRENGEVKAISTGFPAVDDKLNGGIRRGELVVLAARPKMGKTAFALNVSCNAAVEHSVLVLSMEMPKSQLHDRNLATLGKIPLEHLLKPAMMTDQDWAGLTNAIVKIESMRLHQDDQGGLRLIDVRMKAKLVKRKHGLDLLVVDYLQLMDGDGDNRNAQIEGITRGLKALAKELDIGIMLLSQLNRKLEERPNKRPMPADLRDSGAIEQDADAVIFLYRDEVYNPDTPNVGVCEVDVALCRQGKPGRAALAYIGEQVRFESLAAGWMPVRHEAKRGSRGLAAHL
ncbi:replicative DNA helicase [Massilia sp. LC238]|uniref:replicative DNA helicase n=1 Tax=Massilia sp. LC238 TaxID=1502852 RepID=UPI0004E379B2|nr:replicative DNA helicase [Massilia sp. LC238]KFC61941.1 Replicative DNA helicase DnaB [Massilia sp. LC238]